MNNDKSFDNNSATLLGFIIVMFVLCLSYISSNYLNGKIEALNTRCDEIEKRLYFK